MKIVAALGPSVLVQHGCWLQHHVGRSCVGLSSWLICLAAFILDWKAIGIGLCGVTNPAGDSVEEGKKGKNSSSDIYIYIYRS